MLTAVVAALRSAGATEEIIAAAVGADGAFRTPHRAGDAARERLARAAKRPPDLVLRVVSRPPDAAVVEPKRPPDIDLRNRLLDVAHGNFDLSSDIAPIRALIDQGCDLKADVVPIVARELPELPRPLKNWGSPSLVRDILAARDQRLAGQPVEAPPAARAPAIEWDECSADTDYR
jgi:hypothetical protein